MRISLSDREVEEVREKVQLIETIIDGATQQLRPDKKRLSLALSAIRSIQSKYFPQLKLTKYKIYRNKLIKNLVNNNIQTQIGTYSSHIQPIYNNSKDKCPNSLEIFERSLSLPIYYTLKEEDVDIVFKHLKKAIEETK